MSAGSPIQPKRFIAGWGVLAALVATLGWLGWRCARDPRLAFLAPHASAAWISYPRPANFDGRTATTLATEFRRDFNLPAAPRLATVTFRAFKRATVIVNGTTVARWTDARDNWKAPQTFAITPLVRPGRNNISITVENAAGPPVLWARLDAGEVRVATDEHWEASCAGATWRPARPADAALPQARDGTDQSFSDASLAWRQRWPTVLFAGMISLGVLAVWSWWSRRSSSLQLSGRPSRLREPAVVMLGIVVAVWIALAAHNHHLLPRVLGFDAPAHLDYIRYIMERRTLPLAHEGAVMYNPPLYYALGAGILSLLSLQVTDPAAADILRALALAGGIGQLLLIAASLRLLLPERRGVQAIGILFAAALPAHLYLSAYVTNEWLVALLGTATIYLTLRALRTSRISMSLGTAIGGCLGLALLTKVTALLLAPFVVGALAMKLCREERRTRRERLAPLIALVLACLAVCGWQYGRVWLHFGRPLVGVWDPDSGFKWWQDPGYATVSTFWRFGAALFHPAFSARNGFWDGIYSTLWGDGLCGGRATGDYRPPWDYALMAVAGWIALVLSALMVAGAVRLLWRFLRQPTPEHLMVVGVGYGFGLALLVMNLKVPCFGEAKAFYGLVALLPACTFVAEGFIWVGSTRPSWPLASVVGTWAILSLATYWVAPAGRQTHLVLGVEEQQAAHWDRAASHFRAALRDDPRDPLARGQLATCLEALQRPGEARSEIARNVAAHPDDALCHVQSAVAAAATGDWVGADAHIDRAVALAPDCAPARTLRLQILRRQNRRPELVAACRESLRLDPANGDVHFALGQALLGATGSEAEAKDHLRLAAELLPRSPAALTSIAWIFATHPDTAVRDGDRATGYAETACELTHRQSVMPLLVLAAAHAEAGRFDRAVEAAQLAHSVANQSGQNELAGQCAQFASLYRARRPFRQPSPGR
ncbi:MAG TPA: tetratricopeptide repeat protein [Opitutaceae bacterium]|nr:tetratricopeptide repeat protein [Opitutaceae bacterium]